MTAKGLTYTLKVDANAGDRCTYPRRMLTLSLSPAAESECRNKIAIESIDRRTTEPVVRKQQDLSSPQSPKKRTRPPTRRSSRRPPPQTKLPRQSKHMFHFIPFHHSTPFSCTNQLPSLLPVSHRPPLRITPTDVRRLTHTSSLPLLAKGCLPAAR